jgi:hypothetical protein
MPAAGVLVSPLGERYYTAQVLAAALGISVKEVEQLAARGHIPPAEVRFGSRRVWPEHRSADSWSGHGQGGSGHRSGSGSVRDGLTCQASGPVGSPWQRCRSSDAG